VLLDAPNKDTYFGPSISSSIATQRILSFEGDESTSYAARDDATADILSSILMCFELVSKRWTLWHVQ
jgi:hypothetical protein